MVGRELAGLEIHLFFWIVEQFYTDFLSLVETLLVCGSSASPEGGAEGAEGLSASPVCPRCCGHGQAGAQPPTQSSSGPMPDRLLSVYLKLRAYSALKITFQNSIFCIFWIMKEGRTTQNIKWSTPGIRIHLARITWRFALVWLDLFQCLSDLIYVMLS